MKNIFCDFCDADINPTDVTMAARIPRVWICTCCRLVLEMASNWTWLSNRTNQPMTILLDRFFVQVQWLFEMGSDFCLFVHFMPKCQHWLIIFRRSRRRGGRHQDASLAQTLTKIIRQYWDFFLLHHTTIHRRPLFPSTTESIISTPNRSLPPITAHWRRRLGGWFREWERAEVMVQAVLQRILNVPKEGLKYVLNMEMANHMPNLKSFWYTLHSPFSLEKCCSSFRKREPPTSSIFPSSRCIPGTTR